MRNTLSRDRDAVRPLVRAAFCAFVFSIPFEYPDRSIPLEVHTVTAALFLLIALTQPRVCFRRPPAAFWFLGLFLWTYGSLALFTVHTQEALKLFLNYLLVLFIFWTGFNLMRREAIARGAWLAFAAACAIVAMLNVLGIATHTVVSDDTLRQIVFGQDANLLGGNMSLALVALIGFVFTTWTSVLARAAAGGAALLIAKSLLLSGSRGAFLALAVGIVAFALQTKSVAAFAKSAAVALAGVLVLTVVVYQSESMWKRYERTVTTGNMSGREQIYPEAWQMFEEKPVFGWGPVDNTYELGLRTAAFTIGTHNSEGGSLHLEKDTHNLLLDALTATGMAGTLPLFACIGFCLWGAWRGRAGPHATMPLALAAALLALSMEANWSASKVGWLAFAFAAASGSRIARVNELPLSRAA